ncbi:hypothetical protein GX50_02235 [[Emmonsia] crescens]|uniref:Uncharacterized protein n=1 Tax=[Emmonsia] crescens TaxID=73230 RepID=A0A2B7ZEI3_9EURO|nr:hypothetical protein GX50_02235 [Emmonsia crescens]
MVPSILMYATALIAPSQPALHLKGLTGSAVTPPKARLSRDVARSWSSLSVGYCVGLLLRPFLGPAPSTDHCLTWTFAQLSRAAMQLGSILDTTGIKSRDKVLVLVPSCVEWAQLH